MKHKTMIICLCLGFSILTIGCTQNHSLRVINNRDAHWDSIGVEEHLFKDVKPFTVTEYVKTEGGKLKLIFVGNWSNYRTGDANSLKEYIYIDFPYASLTSFHYAIEILPDGDKLGIRLINEDDEGL